MMINIRTQTHDNINNVPFTGGNEPGPPTSRPKKVRNDIQRSPTKLICTILSCATIADIHQR